MPDDLINLLPEELRSSETSELNQPTPPAGGLAYTKAEPNLEPIQPLKPVNSNQASPEPKPESMSAPVKDRIPQASVPKTDNAKQSAVVSVSEPKPAKPSFFQTLLNLISVKPKSSALDQVARQTNGSLNFDVNLVPQTAYYLSGKVLALRLVLAALLVVLIISVLHLGLALLGRTATTELSSLQQTLVKNQESLSNYKDLAQQLGQLEVQNASISGLVSRHIYWTQFLTFLEGLTLPTIYYESMSATPDGKLDLQVVAPTYTDAAQQLIFWQSQATVKSIEFSGVSADPTTGQVNFSVRLTVDPTIFYKK